MGAGRRGSPQPLLPDPQELPPAQVPAAVPAAAAGGDSAFLAKRPDLLCSRNYEKNVCHELSRGRLSEERGLKGPRRAAWRPAPAMVGGNKARHRESFWGVRAVAAGQGCTPQSQPPGIDFPERRNDPSTPQSTSLLGTGSKESQGGISGPSHKWDMGPQRRSHLRSHSSQWQN